MRIAFVTEQDPYDRAASSGSTYQILQIILTAGAAVEVVGPVQRPWRFQAMRIASIPSRLSGHGMAWPKHPFLLKSYAKRVDWAVQRINPDVVFSPGSNTIAYSSFFRPTIFWSDAPFGALVDYYPWSQYQNLTERSRQQGMLADTRALRYSYASIYRSSWARDCAVKLHHADPARVHVLPLPGNLFQRCVPSEIEALIPQRLMSPWKIFFSGVDWERKGGDRAIAVLNELVKLGQPCELEIAGVVPPTRSLQAAQFPVHVLGRLNLNDPAKRQLLSERLIQSTFLLVPTKAEALGLVFCESLGAGVPSFGTNTGGVPDAITDGVTGCLIAPDETPRVTAQRMLEAGQPEKYATLVRACCHQWSTRFAMDAIRTKLIGILEGAASASYEPHPAALVPVR